MLNRATDMPASNNDTMVLTSVLAGLQSLELANGDFGNLPESARNLRLAFHKVNLLKDLFLAILAEVIFIASLLVVLHVARVAFIVQAASGFLGVVFHVGVCLGGWLE